MSGRQLLLGAIEGRAPTQMMAGVASDKAYTAGKDLLEDVFFNHKKNLEDKVGGFNKHFDKQIMKHKTRYAEKFNVQNTNKIDDVKGSDAAYSNVNGITRIGNTLYIGGTGAKTGLNHKVNDVIADLFFIPTHNVQLSERYRDAMEELSKNPDDWSVIPSVHPLFKKSTTDTETNMQLLCIHHLLYQGLINRKTRDTYDLEIAVM